MRPVQIFPAQGPDHLAHILHGARALLGDLGFDDGARIACRVRPQVVELAHRRLPKKKYTRKYREEHKKEALRRSASDWEVGDLFCRRDRRSCPGLSILKTVTVRAPGSPRAGIPQAECRVACSFRQRCRSFDPCSSRR